MSIFEDVTIAAIKARREQGYGLAEARRILRREAAERAVTKLRANGGLPEELSELLLFLVREVK